MQDAITFVTQKGCLTPGTPNQSGQTSYSDLFSVIKRICDVAESLTKSEVRINTHKYAIKMITQCLYLFMYTFTHWIIFVMYSHLGHDIYEDVTL